MSRYSYADHLIEERLGTDREGIKNAYQTDPQTKLTVDMLRRFTASVEDGCNTLQIDPELRDQLLQIVVIGSLPSMPDVKARQEQAELFTEHLSTHHCFGPERPLHPNSSHPSVRRRAQF